MKNKRYIIIVEGETDEAFLKAYCSHLSINVDTNENITIEFTKGCTNLEKKKGNIKQRINEGYKIAILFDADGEGKESSGYGNMKAFIKETLPPAEYQYDTFLLPNNREDGNLETLLEKIINPAHRNILDCFDKFKDCLKKDLERGDKKYIMPNDKAKMYAYITSLKKEAGGDNYFFSDKDCWDLDNENLNPLRDFLKDFFI